MRMSLFGVSLLLSGMAISDVRSQSLSGIQIGENVAVLSRLGFPPSARNQMEIFTLSKWKFPNENEISTTSITKSGKIVYIESNWGGFQGGTITDFPGFYFGKTSLVDLRRKFRNNGFTFDGRVAAMGPDRSIIMFNSYEIVNRSDLIVTFVTKISNQDAAYAGRDPSIAANFAKLDAIILGDGQYLRRIWGTNLNFDPDYQKIIWK